MRTASRSRSVASRAAAAAVLAVGLVALAACAPQSEPAPAVSVPSTPSAQGVPQTVVDLEGMTAVEAIDTLEAVPVSRRPQGLMASVRPGELMLDDGSSQQTLPVADGSFYLSVAPYRDSTHDCYFHSLTTCVGEMGGEEVHITVVADDGTVVLEGDRVAADNGFIGLWLPSGISGELTIEADGGAVVAPIATGEGDPTCLTGLQLS